MPKEEDKTDNTAGSSGGGASTGKAASASTNGSGSAAKPLGQDLKSQETQAQGSKGQDGKAQATGQTDAIAMLKQDHRTVEFLFDRYESAGEAAKAGLVEQICEELIIHTMLEEEIFYPAARSAQTEDIVEEAQVEHDSAKVLILDLLDADTEYRDAKVKVLTEQIKAHVKEEEAPDGLFAKAQKAGVNTPDLARELSELKLMLKQKAERGRLPPPRVVSLETIAQATRMENTMDRSGRDRDQYGRFTSDDDDRRYGSRSRMRDDDDDRRYSRGRDYDDDDRRGAGRERDERGRFMSEDDDDRRYARSRGRDYDDDDRGRSRSGQGGWFGDPEGHSRASQRGWDEREGSSRGRSRYDEERSYRGRDRDDDDRGRARDRGHGGWFGDSEGHAEAARRGWDEREGASRGRSRADDDDDRGYGRGAGRMRDDEGRFTASRGRGRDDDDDRGRSRGRGHGGWFGDSEGHSRAAQRGWDDR